MLFVLHFMNNNVFVLGSYSFSRKQTVNKVALKWSFDLQHVYDEKMEPDYNIECSVLKFLNFSFNPTCVFYLFHCLIVEIISYNFCKNSEENIWKISLFTILLVKIKSEK